MLTTLDTLIRIVGKLILLAGETLFLISIIGILVAFIISVISGLMTEWRNR